MGAPAAVDCFNFMRGKEGFVEPFSGVLPLDDNAGIPVALKCVELSKVLADDKPEVAAQVANPRTILLPPGARPSVLKRPFVKVGPNYSNFVRCAVKCGLQRLVGVSRVWKFKGKPLISGAFAVPKDEEETRAISALCPINQIIDDTTFI